MSTEFDIVIVGSGFSGLGMAIRLKQRGIGDFVVLERGDDVGGTWHHNTYPGCACDVPSHLYSFSFAQRRHWSRICSPQDEILEYVREVAQEFGVDRLVVPNTEVASCAWDEEARRWTVTSCDGRAWKA